MQKLMKQSLPLAGVYIRLGKKKKDVIDLTCGASTHQASATEKVKDNGRNNTAWHR